MSAAAACSRASPPPAGSSSPRSSRPSSALAGLSDRRRQHAERRGQQPEDLRLDRQRRHRHHRRAPRRDGQRRRAHRSADDRRRRARGRLGARARRAVAGRREDLRQPGHRRLAQRAPLHPADAAVRRRGAADAGDGRRQARGRSTPARSQAQLHEVVHKPSGRKLGYGELAADAAALPVPAADKIKLKEASAFRYIGKGNVAHRRPLRHHDRQGDLRPGRRCCPA